jgi:hypothetical protein
MNIKEMSIEDKKKLLRSWVSDLDEDALDTLIEEYLDLGDFE